MTSSTPHIKVKDLDHCGIIAGIIDEIGLVAEIDKLIGRHGNQKVTTGQAVKAMIINGMGMITSPLYLFEKFFEGKATEHLLGEGILPGDLNDDCLGRALDKLYAAGVTKVFITLALKAAKKMGVEIKSLHLDSSSFHVDGKYLEDEAAEAEPGKISITKGYSRDPIKEAQNLLTLPKELFLSSSIEGYKIAEVGSYYAGIKQRWLVVESEQARESDLKKIEKRLAKKLAQAQSQLKAGRFILASNVLDYDQFSNSELLIEYKAQQSTERGFRCLGARSLASFADMRSGIL